MSHLDIAKQLNGQLSINSAGNEIATTAQLHESLMPESLTPETLAKMQEYRNNFCAGFAHNASTLMKEHFVANPGDGQIVANVPFGMDTFNVTGTMNGGQLHFVTAYNTNGGQPMLDVHGYLSNLAAQVAKS